MLPSFHTDKSTWLTAISINCLAALKHSKDVCVQQLLVAKQLLPMGVKRVGGLDVPEI